MEWWNSLISAPKTMEKVTDAVISTGDKLFYTDEEKADMSFKMRDQFISMLKAYEPFKIAQRVLAFWFAFLFGLSFIVGLAISIFNMIITYKATLDGIKKEAIVTIPLDPLFTLITAFSLGWIMMAIVTFYFLGGSFESLKKKV